MNAGKNFIFGSGSNPAPNRMICSLYQVIDPKPLMARKSLIGDCGPRRPDPSRSLASGCTKLNNNLIDIQLAGGLNNIQLAFNESMSSGEEFSFDYAAAGGVSATPLPPAWTMMLIGLAGFSFAACRRKDKASLEAA
jgi:hypothetical protein